MSERKSVMGNVISDREIRVGVLGAFRGEVFAKTAKNSGMKLVGICDHFKARLDEVCKRQGVPGYEDFDEFIKQDFDALVVAAPFHLHAHFAIKAMDHGKHVLSETSCNITLAEGVKLYRKAQETGLCYMLAENYCYTKFNQEMKRLYDEGEIGEVRYAEGEYNHPMKKSDTFINAPGRKHWRYQLPSCYYNTHALAPMMYITNTLPVAVSCVLVPSPEQIQNGKQDGMMNGRSPFVMLVRMDNGAVFRIIGGGFAGHSCWYGFHGTTGAMEASRGHGYFGPESVRVWHEPWMLKPGQVTDRTYMPSWPSHEKEAEETGHGGGDFFVEYHFAEAIRTGVMPYLDAYHGITMTNVGILAWRSANEGGRFIPIPDLKNIANQEEMLKDRLCPFEGVEDSVLMPPEMRFNRVFTEADKELARGIWKDLGYTEKEVEELLNQ